MGIAVYLGKIMVQVTSDREFELGQGNIAL